MIAADNRIIGAWHGVRVVLDHDGWHCHRPEQLQLLQLADAGHGTGTHWGYDPDPLRSRWRRARKQFPSLTLIRYDRAEEHYPKGATL